MIFYNNTNVGTLSYAGKDIREVWLGNIKIFESPKMYFRLEGKALWHFIMFLLLNNTLYIDEGDGWRVLHENVSDIGMTGITDLAGSVTTTSYFYYIADGNLYRYYFVNDFDGASPRLVDSGWDSIHKAVFDQSSKRDIVIGFRNGNVAVKPSGLSVMEVSLPESKICYADEYRVGALGFDGKLYSGHYSLSGNGYFRMGVQTENVIDCGQRGYGRFYIKSDGRVCGDNENVVLFTISDVRKAKISGERLLGDGYIYKLASSGSSGWSIEKSSIGGFTDISGSVGLIGNDIYNIADLQNPALVGTVPDNAISMRDGYFLTSDDEVYMASGLQIYPINEFPKG